MLTLAMPEMDVQAKIHNNNFVVAFVYGITSPRNAIYCTTSAVAT